MNLLKTAPEKNKEKSTSSVYLSDLEQATKNFLILKSTCQHLLVTSFQENLFYLVHKIFICMVYLVYLVYVYQVYIYIYIYTV